ncbi:putative Sin3 complex subunit (Stb2) [Aspergillus homomorphus CBS 101889]|uniref:Sin3 complex subunit n=1 Tax=Aspergillus homomorphus (strain CBS 101889) TaxID=1450537 RepID=A0A395IBG6_ASPHC|nr:Sin3 complex subunit [Aspergillus homomorphus CBS 101889]RAL17572.1 Sin3 complex subunit [Aspergillus homomorphus CBS 101889]
MPPSPTQTGAQATPVVSAPREPTKSVPKESPLVQSAGPEGQSPPPCPGHQNLVFTDPVAFRYLEEDRCTVVLHRRLILEGYEVYIVEQWACTRIHPTFIITTYTGDPSHKVTVGVLSVPTDESAWSPRLRLYLNAVVQCQAQKRDTPLGTLMVTDLSIFPCALTLIPVPDGDVLKHKDDFIVNENLKRLGCSGRASLKLQPPSPATEAKFHHLYRTSERVPLYSAVIELVKQCQIALMMFGILAPEYVDGLLCDMTEAAIADWWTEIGMDLYNIEPSDSMLGPISVSALLGTLIGARNRLHAFGAPVGKDAFDIQNLKRGIGSFQKSQKMKRTRRLDRQTLDRLHRATAKAANAEGWTDAVKSTMAELSGHGGEMVMGMVRGREKSGIADIETLDIDTFARLVKGERAKWLWRGKPRKGGIGESFEGGPFAADMVHRSKEQGGYPWTTRKRHSHEDLTADRPPPDADRSRIPPEAAAPFDEKDQNLSSIVRRGVSGKVSDARAGFGRFKDAVGLRSHPSKHTREGQYAYSDSSHLPPIDSDTEPSQRKKPDGDPNVAEQGSVHESEGRALTEDVAGAESVPSIVPPQSPEAKAPAITVEAVPDNADSESARKVPIFRADDEVPDEERRRTPSTDVSADRERTPDIGITLLRRPQSCGQLGPERIPERTDGRWPRHLSFSTVEEVVLGWDGFGGVDERPDAPLEEAVVHEDILASDARLFSAKLRELSEQTAPWVEQQVASVDDLNRCLYENYEKINTAYLERLAVFQQLRGKSSDLLTEEHTHLADYMRRVELMGAKLDYELHVLESKVEDVETGLGEFERHVADVETRVRLLVRGEKDRENSSWLSWLGKLAGLSS